jgi:hypothetical protein
VTLTERQRSSFVSCSGGHLVCAGTAKLRDGRCFRRCFCRQAGFISGTIKTVESRRLSLEADVDSSSQAVAKQSTTAENALPASTHGRSPASDECCSWTLALLVGTTACCMRAISLDRLQDPQDRKDLSQRLPRAACRRASRSNSCGRNPRKGLHQGATIHHPLPMMSDRLIRGCKTLMRFKNCLLRLEFCATRPRSLTLPEFAAIWPSSDTRYENRRARAAVLGH